MLPLVAFLWITAAQWVPARWNSADPASLDLLAGTPINCLVLRRTEPGFVRVAAARGIATLAVLQDVKEVPAAAALHMNGVVVEGGRDVDALRRATVSAGLVFIHLPARRNLNLATPDAVTGTVQGVWPGIQATEADAGLAGPTSAPWIETNAGFLRFARATGAPAIWIANSPPAKTVYPVSRYLQAIADAATTGARWVVSLDDDFEHRLLARQPAALTGWKEMARHLQYFEDHREWREYRSFGEFAVMQDSRDTLFSGGILDMVTAQRISARPIAAPALNEQALAGIRILLNASTLQVPPRPGMLELKPEGNCCAVKTPADEFKLRDEDIKRLEPVYKLVETATARQNFGVQLFNVASVLSSAWISRDNGTLAVHLVNYSDYPTEAITARFRRTWKRARLYRPEAPPRDLLIYPAKEGTGVEIERIGTIATLVMDDGAE